jgi:hypothetical protein
MDKYQPRNLDELAEAPTPRSLISRPVHENVALLVASQPRSLSAIIAQTLADTENLIARLEVGVDVAASGRELVRELYVQCRKQRELLAAVLELNGLE